MFGIDQNSINCDVLLWSIRSFYIFASYAIIIVRFIPDLRFRFLDYGARSSKSSKPQKKDDSVFPTWVRDQVDPLLDTAADITVPHNWFSHFYVVSTVCTAFWMSVLVREGQVGLFDRRAWYRNIWQLRTAICMVLLQVQGLRRLFESLVVAKSSKSRMWIGHYLIGLAFYLVTNVAIWLEPVLENPGTQDFQSKIGTPEAVFEVARTITCVVLFTQFSYKQHQVHKYLAGLQGYQVPNHPIYRYTNLICPHYWFEINIYLVLSVLSAREMRILNVTMVCAMGFVMVNLGVTADLTKKWLMEKFPKQRAEIAQRKKMLGSIW